MNIILRDICDLVATTLHYSRRSVTIFNGINFLIAINGLMC